MQGAVDAAAGACIRFDGDELIVTPKRSKRKIRPGRKRSFGFCA